MSDREPQKLERRARAVLDASVTSLDAHVRSRLAQARHAALAAAERPRVSWPPASWLPAGALAAAAVLGVALWLGQSGVQRIPAASTPPAMAATAVEDVEIFATNDAIELFAEDPEFYEWADSGPGTDDNG
jgi:hypothetical protein